MTSDARAGLREQDDAATTPEVPEPTGDDLGTGADSESGATAATVADDGEGDGGDGTEGRRGWRRRPSRDDGDAHDRDPERPARRWSGPRTGVLVGLAVLWVLLLAAAAFLWLKPPGRSSVSTGDYVQALEAARSEVVDLTSFDYLTLDADIARIKRVSTGDLQKESVAQLDKQRQQLTKAQAVVNTEVVGAGVTKADASGATVLLVIQSTQKSAASPKAQVVRYRIEAQLTKTGGTWLLSGITGR